MKLNRLMQSIGLAVATLGFCSAGWQARADDLTSNLMQDQANRLSIFHDYSISALGTTEGRVPGANGSGLFTSMLGSLGSTSTTSNARAYSVSATPLLGYDSNPEGRAKSRSSAYAGIDLNAGYALQLDPNDPSLGGPTDLFFNYDLNGGIYEGRTKQANVFQNTATAAVRHAFFGDTLVTNLLLQDQFTVEHGYAFLNTFDVVPSVEEFFLPQLSVEGTYDYARMDYFFKQTNANQDPTSDRHTIMGYINFYTLPPSMTAEVQPAADRATEILRNLFSRATLGFGHVFNRSGRDWEYESNRLMFGFEGIRPLQIAPVSFDLEYSREWQSFSNRNSFTQPVLSFPHTFNRHDHLDMFTLRGNARLLDLAKNAGTISGFLQWDIISDQSNLKIRSFNEYLVSGGLTYRY